MDALQSWAIQNALGLAWFEQAGGGVGGGRASPPCAMVATSKVLMAVESWCCNLLF